MGHPERFFAGFGGHSMAPTLYDRPGNAFSCENTEKYLGINRILEPSGHENVPVRSGDPCFIIQEKYRLMMISRLFNPSAVTHLLMSEDGGKRGDVVA